MPGQQQGEPAAAAAAAVLLLVLELLPAAMASQQCLQRLVKFTLQLSVSLVCLRRASL
jgi:hypothetical protein